MKTVLEETRIWLGWLAGVIRALRLRHHLGLSCLISKEFKCHVTFLGYRHCLHIFAQLKLVILSYSLALIFFPSSKKNINFGLLKTCNIRLYFSPYAVGNALC